MSSIRNLLNLFEQAIDPGKVKLDNEPIDPSKVVLDNPSSVRNQFRPSPSTIPFDKNVKSLQDEIVKAGGKFPKFGPDGKWGNETAGVVFSDPKYVEIARKYADTIPQVKSILGAKDFAKDVSHRTDAAVASLPSATGTVKINASNSAAQADSSAGQSEEERKAEWTPTPEQEKWLGGANRQDPYIMNRMPGAKPPLSYFKSPEDKSLAQRVGFKESVDFQSDELSRLVSLVYYR